MASKSTVTHVLQQFLFQPLLIEGETNTDEILSVIQKSRKDWKNGEVSVFMNTSLIKFMLRKKPGPHQANYTVKSQL